MVAGVRPAASSYAVIKAVLAAVTTALGAVYLVPVVVTKVSPVKAGVGSEPKSPPAVPLTVVGPVLVMPEPASTAKFEVEPRFTVG